MTDMTPDTRKAVREALETLRCRCDKTNTGKRECEKCKALRLLSADEASQQDREAGGHGADLKDENSALLRRANRLEAEKEAAEDRLAALTAERDRLREALVETERFLTEEPEAFTKTLWVKSEPNLTLLEMVQAALADRGKPCACASFNGTLEYKCDRCRGKEGPSQKMRETLQDLAQSKDPSDCRHLKEGA